MDPSVFESGPFKNTLNRYTQRGSSRLRHILYIVICKKKKTDGIIPRNSD
ncbi:hypothetical protein ACIQZI_19630 [Peribacillus sp. NPDC096379]